MSKRDNATGLDSWGNARNWQIPATDTRWFVVWHVIINTGKQPGKPALESPVDSGDSTSAKPRPRPGTE